MGNKWGLMIPGVFSILFLFISSVSSAGGAQSCQEAHRKAVTACAAHEHAVNAEALSIVSSRTRERVVSGEEGKLQNIKKMCRQTQARCAEACNRAIVDASLDASDVTLPLEKLTDCRQGEVARHLKAMDQKLLSLKKMTGGRQPSQARIIKSAYKR